MEEYRIHFQAGHADFTLLLLGLPNSVLTKALHSIICLFICSAEILTAAGPPTSTELVLINEPEDIQKLIKPFSTTTL